MVFPIAGGTQDTGYEISNSLRFNDDDGAYLQRTAGANTGEDNATLSFWFKLSAIKTDNNGGTIMTEGGTTGNHIVQIYANKIYIGSGAFGIMFPNVIRDVSAWYHLFIAFDTSQSTNTNRVKAYLNGVLLTDATGFTDYPDQNENLGLCVNGNTTRVGSRGNTGASAFDGYLAEFHFLDGTTKAYTDFGEFNDNGVWIPKKYIGGSYGDNGFYLEFKQTGTSADASGIGADTSGEGHHFSVSSVVATDVTTDTPTNNFNTLNPLVPHHSIFDAETEGNTGLSSSGVQLQGGYMGSTIMPTSGKWYFEVNILSISNSSDRTGIAIPRFDSVTGITHIEGGDYAGFTVSTGSVGRVFITEGDSTTETDNSEYVFNGASVAIFAVDMDASTPRVYVGKNGTWFTTSAGSGGNPATNTGYFEANLNTGGSGFSVGARHSAGSSASQSMLYNFGQPAYTISSGNSDANGYGNFEYAVPSGYYAICTKNLAEFG